MITLSTYAVGATVASTDICHIAKNYPSVKGHECVCVCTLVTYLCVHTCVRDRLSGRR